ncbi:hypothetical protein HMPREF1318_0231 [Actinomyces massiliensis F0489]|uniref:Uncharacterized protein n=1 Tax=Actinomyces massiliensis F0489 TaxID=1125718 RepID=J0WIV7_9ACTO|nr:hypothetical protein HMPREF1318_0231 [Actinomyces massiliensis F0489]
MPARGSGTGADLQWICMGSAADLAVEPEPTLPTVSGEPRPPSTGGAPKG